MTNWAENIKCDRTAIVDAQIQGVDTWGYDLITGCMQTAYDRNAACNTPYSQAPA
jgi:hypothetical protein